MARLRLPFRGRGEPAEGKPPPSRRPVPPPGMLRRERRELIRLREERLRDLGGLLLEMYRRDRFREDLIREQCGELIAIEARVQELDFLLSRGRSGSAERCACGAPVLGAAHFCANCGRPTGSEPVAACVRCEHALPADARYCPACGAEAEELERPAAAREPEEPSAAEATMAEPAKAAADPWEG